MVRAIWEEHLGWFRFESTTELYNVPPAAVLPDLVELAGGPQKVIGQAARHLAAGRPLHALHLAEAALAADPTDVNALRMKLAATESLLQQNNRENFSEVRWLEGQVSMLREALSKVPP